MSTTLWPGALDAFDLLGPGEFHENSSDLWNDLRAALESMEGTLGIDPAGQKADFDTRLSVHFDADGAYKHISYVQFISVGLAIDPVAGTGLLITHSSAGKFTQIPHAFVGIADTGSFVTADDPGVLTCDDVSVTQARIYGRRLNGNQVEAGSSTSYNAIFFARETSPTATIYAL